LTCQHNTMRSPHTNAWRHRNRILIGFLLLIVVVLVIKSSQSQADTATVPEVVVPVTIFDAEAWLSNIDRSPLRTNSKSTHNNCVATLMTNHHYVSMVQLLGYTLDKVQSKAKKIALVTDSITEEVMDKIKKTGWIPVPVDVIPQPGQESSDSRFRMMFTKLHLWRLIECRSLVYVDSDTLVLHNFDELFEFTNYAPFAAAPDNWYGKFTVDINAGVMVLKPSLTEFDQLITSSVNNTDKYSAFLAEQGYLNWYYYGSMIRLPLIYNGNMATWRSNEEFWSRTAAHTKVLHYTLQKPVLPAPDNVTDPYLSLWYETWEEMHLALDLK
jgi:alpha-N-acetylglucosamine transferase